VAIQALVEGDGGGEAGDEGVDGFTEAAAPGLIGLVSAHEFARIGWKKVTLKAVADNNRVANPVVDAGRQVFFSQSGPYSDQGLS